MADRDDGFLSRWSRRKRDPEAEPDPTAGSEEDQEDQEAGTDGAPPQDAEEGDEEAGDPEVIAKLPDIDSLDETSDFTPFLAEGVPEILRRRALRKLWRLNPVFANLDGLAEYDEDYTDAANLLSEIKTVYKVGQGMLEREPGTTPAEPAAEASEEAADVEEREPAEPQTGDDPEALTEVAANQAEPPVDRPVPDGPDRPAALGAVLPKADAAEDAAEAEPDPGRDTAPDPAVVPARRRAAARRWGESTD